MYEEVKRQQELDGCTFQPTTGDKSHLPLQTHDVPVEERLLATENQLYARVSRREAMKRDLELEGCTSVWKSNTELGYLNAIEQMQLRGGRRVDGVGGPKVDFHIGVHSNRSWAAAGLEATPGSTNQ